jgi:hypothetical protein
MPIPVSTTSTFVSPSEKTSDVFGRQKVTIHQNVYEADFEYGSQPLRWEGLTYGTASITQIPSLGGVIMTVSSGSNDMAIRQSRPYHRYQPGKSMYMAANVNFGGAITNQFQRCGFFDDSNGVFFEQAASSSANPYGIFVCVRTDASPTGMLPVTTRIPLDQFNGDLAIAKSLNWALIQMIWIEYAWYGAGIIRFGVTMGGEQYLLHTINTANTGTTPWARTGNLPVRYEIRNSGSISPQVTSSMAHYGVSVIVEGGRDAQRGFTYSYGVNPSQPLRNVAANVTRVPILSIQNRTMGTQEYTQVGAVVSSATATSMTVSGTPWTTNQWLGKFINFPLSGSNPVSSSFVGRITGSTNNTVHYVDVVTGLAITGSPIPPANATYSIGLINRGQILPQSLVISADKTCVIELISSIPDRPILLTGSLFTPMANLGAPNSFATRDISAVSMSGGEVVYAFVSPANSGLQVFDLSNFFPLYNTIRGGVPDILTVAVTTSGSAANVGVHLVGQEAMS